MGKTDAEYFCPMLQGRNVVMQGDSMMRHTFYAMLLLLSGAVADPPWILSDRCMGNASGLEGPFNEPVQECRHLAQDGWQKVCGGNTSVMLIYDAFGMPSDNNDKKTVVVWGIGNHPLDGDYTDQKKCLSMPMYKQERFDALCARDTGTKERILWMPPHISQADLWGSSVKESVQKLMESVEGGFHSLSHRQAQFARQSSSFLRACGISSLSTSLLTLPLSHANATGIFGQVAGDTQHYGRVVNLFKARILLHRLVRLFASLEHHY